MNRIRRIAFNIFMFLPLVYAQVGTLATRSDMRATQESFFQYFVFCMTACFVGNTWLSLFLVWNVILYIYNGQEVGSMQVINVLLGCLLFMFSRAFFKSNKFSDIYKYILIVMGANILWMGLQLFGIDPIFHGKWNGTGEPIPGTFTDPIGFFGIKMANGIFLNLCFPIVAAVAPLALPLLLIPIYLTQSSVVVLSVGVTALFYTFHMHRKMFLLLLLLIPIACGFYFFKDIKTDTKTFTSRFPVWHSAIKYTLKNDHGWLGLVGYGPDSYRNVSIHKNFLFTGDNFYNHGILTREPGRIGFSYYVPDNDIKKIDQLMSNIDKTSIAEKKFDEWDNPHCGYITMFFQYGMIGLFLLGGLVRDMWIRFKYTIKDKELVVISSCILVYFVTSIGHFPLEIARTAYLFPILLGAFYAKTDGVNA